jgi:hypothetical protein
MTIILRKRKNTKETIIVRRRDNMVCLLALYRTCDDEFPLYVLFMTPNMVSQVNHQLCVYNQIEKSFMEKERI